MESTPSPTVNIIVSIIPIVGIVMGSVVIFFYLLWSHKQRMLMIQKDVYEKKFFDLESFSLFTGLLLLGIGVSLAVFFILKDGIGYGVLSGLIPLSLGISMIVFFILKRNLPGNE